MADASTNAAVAITASASTSPPPLPPYSHETRKEFASWLRSRYFAYLSFLLGPSNTVEAQE